MEGYDTYMAMVTEISMKDGEPVVHRVVTAADLGRMVNPDTVEAQIQSSIIFGLSAALWGDITVDKGRVQQTNFDKYRLMRNNEAPQIEVMLVQSTEKPGGIGEPGTALIGPAVGNAIFAATGKRVRRMPFTKEIIAQARGHLEAAYRPPLSRGDQRTGRAGSALFLGEAGLEARFYLGVQAARARHAGEQELHLVGQDAAAAQDHVLVQAGHVGQVQQASCALPRAGGCPCGRCSRGRR